MRYRESPARNNIAAGIANRKGEVKRKLLPSAIIAPSVGNVGGSPHPRNERLDSVRMVVEKIPMLWFAISG